MWLDAPIGYRASLQNYCDTKGDCEFDDYWHKDSTAELYHFVGKDIVYFHALFWPAMLAGSGYRLPTAIYTHGFLTINGQKMSKSRGTFINAADYLQHLNPEYLRYYFAAKLNDSVEDIDLNEEDFFNRVNADLIGKVVNIASRCASFINKAFAGHLSASLPKPSLLTDFTSQSETIAELYENRDFAKAVRQIMDLADKANRYIDDEKPWVLAKQVDQDPKVQQVCTQGLNLFRVIMLYLKPILPILAEKSETFLNIQPQTWEDVDKPLLEHQINAFEPLMQRMQREDLAKLFTS